MTSLQSSLVVEIYLDRARITGLLPNVSQNRRLVDVLGNQDLSFQLESAEACLAGGEQPYRFKSMTIKKSDVLYAIPRETQDQIRARALYRTGMSTQATASTPLAVLLNTCHISGKALVPPSMNRQNLEATSFPSFFALTGATITQADGSTSKEQVVIVNRDAILALGRPDEA